MRKTGNGGKTSVYLIIALRLFAQRCHSLDFQQRGLALTDQLECGVHHHVHAEEHEAQGHHFRFLSPEEGVHLAGEFQLVLHDTDTGEFVPVHFIVSIR